MKNLLIVAFLCTVQTGMSQNVSYSGDTIYVNGKSFAVLKQTHMLPQTYSIETLNKEELVRIYPGKMLVKNKQPYIITFMNDGKQALQGDSNDFINKLIMTFVRNNIVKDGAVNSKAEELFIKKHPVPKGYPDVEQLRNYG